ncbi:MAG: peptidase [Massilia sp.]|nr:peptidase [Massilia sp.]
MKKWVIAIALVPVVLVGAMVAPPLVVPIWDQYRPRPVVPVDSAMRRQTIDALVAEIRDHYVFPQKAAEVETLLRQRQRNGAYDAISDGEQLATTLTEDMASVAADKHMRVDFSPDYLPPLPPRKSELPSAPDPTGLVDVISRRMANFVANFGVEKVELMPSNIGYLELSSFPFPEMTADKYGAAMDKLAGTDSLIIDLRENGGGLPTSVALSASYFFDQRTRLNGIWWRDTGRTDQLWTAEALAGKRYGGQKKVAILIGPHTRSAAEDFAYTMQTLKRATLIGAPTWGGAHPAFNYRLGDHFNARIPNARTISPITNTNWEGVGVIPDVEATPEAALGVAQAHLLRKDQRAAFTGGQ